MTARFTKEQIAEINEGIADAVAQFNQLKAVLKPIGAPRSNPRMTQMAINAAAVATMEIVLTEMFCLQGRLADDEQVVILDPAGIGGTTATSLLDNGIPSEYRVNDFCRHTFGTAYTIIKGEV